MVIPNDPGFAQITWCVARLTVTPSAWTFIGPMQSVLSVVLETTTGHCSTASAEATRAGPAASATRAMQIRAGTRRSAVRRMRDLLSAERGCDGVLARRSAVQTASGA